MKNRATIKDVAAKAGVGVATVDRVLNGRAPVTKSTATRVLAAAEDLNYHASRLMRHRIDQIVPNKTLGFVLQKRGKWFYQTLAREIRQATAAQREIRGTVEIEYVESLSPDHLAEALSSISESVDAVALVATDHPKVSAAISKCAENGIPVLALLSRLNAADIAGYVGIDGRKAGRTAGWAMARLSGKHGDVGILIGSHRYLGHEDREVGFRSYMREHAPGIGLRDSLVYLDDAAVAYEATAEILGSYPHLTGLYHCGGGVEGVTRALREAGRAQDILYICHERSPIAVQGLLDGTVDLVIANPIREIALTVTRAMAAVSIGSASEPTDYVIDFQIVSAENI